MLYNTTLKRNKSKVPYKKSEAVKILEKLAFEQARGSHPTMKPEHLAPRRFRDDNANHLTDCIVKYITLRGGFASRISNQGTYNLKLHKYIPGTSKRGLPDIIGTLSNGRSIFCEVKHGRDKIRPDQEKIKQEQERLNGLYFIARNFSDFKTWFDAIK